MIEVQSRTSCEDLLKEKDKEIEKLVDELEEQERHIKEANKEIERLNNIINELNDKIEDDKMIIKGNWGCIDNLRKDYNLHKNIIKEVREYANEITKKYWSDDGRAIIAEKVLEILGKEVN